MLLLICDEVLYLDIQVSIALFYTVHHTFRNVQ